MSRIKVGDLVWYYEINRYCHPDVSLLEVVRIRRIKTSFELYYEYECVHRSGERYFLRRSEIHRHVEEMKKAILKDIDYYAEIELNMAQSKYNNNG